jgi:hypothetical protein
MAPKVIEHHIPPGSSLRPASEVRELLVIGIDPGPTPGLVLLRYTDHWLERSEAVQCSHGALLTVLQAFLMEDSHPDLTALVQVERFVVRRGSGKSGQAGALTRDLIGAVEREVGYFSRAAFGGGVAVTQQNAGRVKGWATDQRLAAVGLYEMTKGMQHARDAARHALFAAVHDGKIPDPLSKRHSSEGAPA